MARRATNRGLGGGIMAAARRVFKGAARKREAAFDGASTGRRTRNWLADGGGVNALTLGSLQMQRNRARDLARKVPWAASAIEAVAADVVGQGIRPNSQSKDVRFRDQLKNLWPDWVMESDADEVLSFYGQQLLVVRTVIEAGECFIRLRPRRLHDGLTVPLQIQVIEPEFVPLDNAFGMWPKPGNVIKQGIEFDRLGKRVAYWIYKNHPHDYSGIGGFNSLEINRVPASEVLHVYKPLRPGQIRGIPWLSSVILRVRDLLEYEDAELIRKKTAAMFVAFVEKSTAGENPLPEDEDEYGPDGDDEVAPTSLETGTVQILADGETIKFSTPPDSGNNYEAFLKGQLRAIAVAVGATYEAMTGDYSDSNFSAARMARNTTQRRTKPFQDTINFQMNQPIMKRFIEAGILAGELIALEYHEKPRDYTRTDWVAPGWPYTNPKEEAAADELRIKAGTASRRKVARERGEEVETIDAEQAEDNARADKLGLKYSSDGRYAIKATPDVAATDTSSESSVSKSKTAGKQ